MSSSFPCSGPNDLPLRVARRPALPAEPPRLAAALAHHRDRRGRGDGRRHGDERSEEHTSELQSLRHLVCRLLLEKKNTKNLKMNTQSHRIASSDHTECR